MSLLRRRTLLGLFTVVAALAVLPASALAANETFSVSPVSPSDGTTPDLTAGDSPQINTTVNFDPGRTTSGPAGLATETAQSMTINLAPGLLSNLNANPSCLTATPDFTNDAQCQIGSGAISSIANLGSVSLAIPASGNLYLAPPQSASDLATIDLHVTDPTTMDAPIDVAVNPQTGGLTLTSGPFPTTALGLPIQIVGVSTTFNSTLNGQPFNRLPSSCSDATSSMTVSYTDGTTGSGSSTFTPTGCSSLPYAPKLTAAVAADPSTGGAEVKTDVTQAADEAATKALTVTFPSGLTPNAAALVPCVTGTACTIGTASATSPLLPGTLNGTVTLGGTINAPTLSVSFPAPFNLTLTGAVNLSAGTVTFSNVPDIPLTDLSLDITGVNGQRAYITDCKPASIAASFTGQGGQTQNVSAPITLTGSCPPPSPGTGSGGGTGTGTSTTPTTPTPAPAPKPTPKPAPKPTVKPTASGSVAGLASGHPKLKFKVTDAPAAKITSVAVGLPSGLKFSRSAIVSHKVCTKKGKTKKCTTTVHAKGLRITGGSAKTVALKAGKLVITLKKAAKSVTITAAGPLVTESKSLRTKVQKHKAGTLRFTLKVTTANHKSTSLTLKLKAH